MSGRGFGTGAPCVKCGRVTARAPGTGKITRHNRPSVNLPPAVDGFPSVPQPHTHCDYSGTVVSDEEWQSRVERNRRPHEILENLRMVSHMHLIAQLRSSRG